MSLLETLSDVTEMLRRAEIDFLIGGSLASSLWGQARTTHDADVVVLLNTEKLAVLDAFVQWPYVMDTESIRAFLSKPGEFASGQILNGETLDKIDLFLVSDSEYTRAEFANRRFVEAIPGNPIPFASPEDMIITKLRWFVLGNQVSDRQWNDIIQMLEVQQGQLNEDYLRKWAGYFEIDDLLEAARAEVAAEGHN